MGMRTPPRLPRGLDISHTNRSQTIGSIIQYKKFGRTANSNSTISVTDDAFSLYNIACARQRPVEQQICSLEHQQATQPVMICSSKMRSLPTSTQYNAKLTSHRDAVKTNCTAPEGGQCVSIPVGVLPIWVATKTATTSSYQPILLGISRNYHC